MSAKFLHVFTDDNRELQKQIGCMTGIFQIFDRQHLVAGRRLTGHSHKRLPPGRAVPTSSTLAAEHAAGSPQIILERNINKSLHDKQRTSMESTRTSFSSSSCSSFSSLECSKTTAQLETLSFDRALKNSPISKAHNVDGRPPRHEPRSDPPDTSSFKFDHRSLDFRDVVKDSINRDSRTLSVKTSPKEEVKNHAVKHKDSPRPAQLSKSMDGSEVVGVNGKSREPVDFNESLRVLVKLKETPWDFSESGELPRSSFEAKAASLYPLPRETRRFSYDGREVSRQSLDSRENSKPPSKLQELPRLSLDSREGSLRNSNFDSKAKSSFDRSNSYRGVSRASNPEKELVNEKRSTSVVAKLMGLEAMPSLRLASQEPIDSNKGFDPSSTQRPKSSKASQENKQDHLSYSPKSSLMKDPSIPPATKDPDSIVKPISISRVPNETAPWKKQDRIHIPQKTQYSYREAPPRQQQPESVYSEIEKRLKELEFRQSNKDLRALKQILDAMQAKGLLDTKKGDQSSSGEDHNLRLPSAQNPKAMHPVPNLIKGSSSPRGFESPIVIMKPAKSVNKSGISPSSVIPLEGLSPLRKLRNGESMDKRKANSNNRMAKEHTPKSSTREISDRKSTIKTEDNVPQKARSRNVQDSSRPQQTARENSGNSVKLSGSLSPRLQQKKLETERRSRPPLPSPDSSRPQRTSANRQQAESISPRGRLRRKPVQAQDNDEQLSECSETTRNFSYQSDAISQRSDGNISVTSQVDIEVTSADLSANMNSSFVQQDSRSPSGRAARKAAAALKQKKPSVGLREEVPTKEMSSSAPEQPSPISVLDASFYQDDLPPSPLKKNPNAAIDDKPPTSDECWTPSGLSSCPSSQNSRSSEINHKKLQSIENLVQKLRELTSTDDKPPNTDHIASLCETQNPDHRYVSEILLASGLLLKDLSSGPMGATPIQLHPSGHPINPDLFLVLEQTKTGWPSKPETSPRPKVDQEKLHRKLVFDVVNEVLVRKLELTGSGPHLERLVRSRKLTGSFPSGQQLLRELCLEIEQFRAGSSRGEGSDKDDDNNNNNKISDEEVLRRSEGWTDFGREVDGVVLEIERSIFKDLIDEIVSGEARPAVQFKSNRRRRQLFPKKA